MNKRTAIIIVSLILVAAIVWYFFLRKPAEVKTVTPTTTPGTGGSQPAQNTPVANDNFPLVKGSKGDNVKYLQAAINKIHPAANLAVDGDFGNSTYLALVTFVGTKYYPVTQPLFTEVLQKANQA